MAEFTKCGVCLGEPLPSGKPCICGGIGTEQAEMRGLRSALFDADDEITRLRAENEQLLEEAFDMGVDMTAMRDENKRLRAALRECADDLEAEVTARYPGDSLDYPVMQARYERDMGPVVRAREALEATDA